MMDRSPSDETMLLIHSRQMVEQFNRQSMNGQTGVGDNENMIVKTGEMENFLSRLPLRPFQQNKLETSKSSPTKSDCANFNEQQSDKFDNNHSPNMDHDDVERKERVLLRPWLESMIESGLVPGLEWIDEEKTMFKVPWKHRSKKTWSMKHSSVFLEWAKNTGRWSEGDPEPNYAQLKTRLRCAFNKAPDIEEMKHLHRTKMEEPYKVYKFIPRKESKFHSLSRRPFLKTTVPITIKRRRLLIARSYSSGANAVRHNALNRSTSFQKIKQEMPDEVTNVKMELPSPCSSNGQRWQNPWEAPKLSQNSPPSWNSHSPYQQGRMENHQSPSMTPTRILPMVVEEANANTIKVCGVNISPGRFQATNNPRELTNGNNFKILPPANRSTGFPVGGNVTLNEKEMGADNPKCNLLLLHSASMAVEGEQRWIEKFDASAEPAELYIGETSMNRRNEVHISERAGAVMYGGGQGRCVQNNFSLDVGGRQLPVRNERHPAPRDLDDCLAVENGRRANEYDREAARRMSDLQNQRSSEIEQEKRQMDERRRMNEFDERRSREYGVRRPSERQEYQFADLNSRSNSRLAEFERRRSIELEENQKKDFGRLPQNDPDYSSYGEWNQCSRVDRRMFEDVPERRQSSQLDRRIMAGCHVDELDKSCMNGLRQHEINGLQLDRQNLQQFQPVTPVPQDQPIKHMVHPLKHAAPTQENGPDEEQNYDELKRRNQPLPARMYPLKNRYNISQNHYSEASCNQKEMPSLRENEDYVDHSRERETSIENDDLAPPLLFNGDKQQQEMSEPRAGKRTDAREWSFTSRSDGKLLAVCDDGWKMEKFKLVESQVNLKNLQNGRSNVDDQTEQRLSFAQPAIGYDKLPAELQHSTGSSQKSPKVVDLSRKEKENDGIKSSHERVLDLTKKMVVNPFEVKLRPVSASLPANVASSPLTTSAKFASDAVLKDLPIPKPNEFVEEPSLADMIQFKYDYKRKKQLITARMVMLVEKEREMKLREKQLEAREEIIFWKENYLRTLINSGVIPPISGFPQLSLAQPEDPKCRPVVTTARCSDYQRTEPSSVSMQRPSNGFLYQKQTSDDWKTPQPIEVRLNPRNAMGNPDLEYHRQLPVGSKELALPSVQANLYRVEKPFSEGSPPNLLKNEVLEIGPSSKVTHPSNGNLFLGMGRKRGRPKGSKNKNKFARFTDCNQQQKSMPQLIAISPLMRRESDCRVSSQSGLFGVDGPCYRSELFDQRSPAPNFLKVNSTVCAKMNGSANPGTFGGERILPPVTQSKLDGSLFRSSSGFIPASANPALFDPMKANNVACDQTRNLLAMAEKSVSSILPPLSPFSSNADNWDEEEEEEEEEEEQVEGKVENEKLECRNDVSSSSADRYLRGDDAAMMDGSDGEDCESQEGCLVIAEETVEA